MDSRGPLDKTVVGVLGTIGSWHRWTPGYSLRHLETLVRCFSPDLLCTEISRADWEADRTTAFPLEYRQCLVPLCRKLGIIVVPVGDRWRGPPSPLRLMSALRLGPRQLNTVAVDRWHRTWALLWPGRERANRALVARVIEAVRRDPGRRVLVTVRVERRYAVLDGLRDVKDVILLSPWSRGRQGPAPVEDDGRDPLAGEIR